MSDVEKKSETQEAAPKKQPYNLREKKRKKQRPQFFSEGLGERVKDEYPLFVSSGEFSLRHELFLSAE